MPKKETAAKKDDLLDEEQEGKGEAAPEKEKAEKPAPKSEAQAEPAMAGPKGNVSEGKHDTGAYQAQVEATKKKLWSGPLTKFLIPLTPGEKPGAAEMVQINGYRLNIKKGAMVEIPVPVAEILARHYQVEMEAGQEKLATRDEQTANALA